MSNREQLFSTLQDASIAYTTVLVSYIQNIDWMTTGALLLLVFRLIYDGNKAFIVMRHWFKQKKPKDEQSNG